MKSYFLSQPPDRWSTGDYPYLEIRPARLYATVDLDLIACDYRLTEAGIDAIRDLAMRYSSRVRSRSRSRPVAFLGSCVDVIYGVLRAEADECGQAMLAVARNHALRHSREEERAEWRNGRA